MNPIEHKIREILTQADIAVDQIGSNDDMTTMGLNSLTLIKSMLEIIKFYDLEIDEESVEFYNIKTIQNMVDFVSANVSEKANA
ncbi:phosphopantetheine-binding protein [Paenibacillus chitinolyticus]|uniref:phosphopantetheine-binding protein n=1 Tax=Paenibacillus chitinolyticus TaxID=79263 RepID=UPI002DB5ADB7|nr:phosphopantetheine-binding protein [Paenibacillus chitinolyticus]MEC0248068.1 phosphopantetheine-binding protein [Paenibacillus chitinolyticus]